MDSEKLLNENKKDLMEVNLSTLFDKLDINESNNLKKETTLSPFSSLEFNQSTSNKYQNSIPIMTYQFNNSLDSIFNFQSNIQPKRLLPPTLPFKIKSNLSNHTIPANNNNNNNNNNNISFPSSSNSKFNWEVFDTKMFNLNSVEVDKKKDCLNKNTLRVLLNVVEAGIIVGKKGETIKYISNFSGTNCNILESNKFKNIDRILTIYGTNEKISLTIELILNKIVNNNKTNIIRIEGDNPRLLTNDNTFLRILIGDTVIGSVLGKYGKKVKKIEMMTDCIIRTFKGMLPGSNERLIEIHGSIKNISNAIIKICQCLNRSQLRNISVMEYNLSNQNKGILNFIMEKRTTFYPYPGKEILLKDKKDLIDPFNNLNQNLTQFKGLIQIKTLILFIPNEKLIQFTKLLTNFRIQLNLSNNSIYTLDIKTYQNSILLLIIGESKLALKIRNYFKFALDS